MSDQKKELIDTTAAMMADIASAVLPGMPTSTLQQLYGRYTQRKLEEARDILIEELRAGGVSIEEAAAQDRLIEVIWRYLDASVGALSRQNQALMAKVIVGLHRADSLNVDKFEQFAGVVSKLTHDQILLVGRFYAHLESVQARRNGIDTTKAHLDAWKLLVAELTPTPFASAHSLEGEAGSLVAGGLIVMKSGFGSLLYEPGPKLYAIGDYCLEVANEEKSA